MTQSKKSQALREKIVVEHMQAEVDKSTSATLETFFHPRYEVIPTNEVYVGEKEVELFLAEGMAAFPDFHFETHHIHHAEDAVIVETTFQGTHLGSWRGIPPTGKSVSYRMCNVFVFEGDDLVCERINFDLLTVLTQLGITRDINSTSGRITLFLNKPMTFISGWIKQLF